MIPHPEDRPAVAASAPAPAPRSPLGLEAAQVSPAVAGRLGLCPVGGVVISALDVDSEAAEEGLQRYDRVIQVGDDRVRTLDDYARAVRAAKRGTMIRLLVAHHPDTQPGCEGRVNYLWVAFLRK